MMCVQCGQVPEQEQPSAFTISLRTSAGEAGDVAVRGVLLSHNLNVAVVMDTARPMVVLVVSLTWRRLGFERTVIGFPFLMKNENTCLELESQSV